MVIMKIWFPIWIIIWNRQTGKNIIMKIAGTPKYKNLGVPFCIYFVYLL